jgi:hypothetical protein
MVDTHRKSGKRQETKMLAAKGFGADLRLSGAARASEYDAMTAVIIMKDKSGAFINELDDDLVCYLHMQLRWVVARVPSDWLARYRGKNVYPRYENVAPLVFILRAGAVEARSAQRLALGNPVLEPVIAPLS